MRLEGKRALVTGGSRSIGRGIALGLAREGADVAVNYLRSREDAESAVRRIEEMGRRAVAVQGSTDSRSDVERFVAEAHDFLGGLDILVNNAGILKRTPLLEISEEEWDAILNVNLKGYFLVGQAVSTPHGRGRDAGRDRQRVVRRAGGGGPEPHPLLRVEGRGRNAHEADGA